MQKIALPQKVTFKKIGERDSGQIIIEPCYPGYGTTLGNSLRRALLSSLPGAAVVGVKIKGSNHEFSTLPNIKEDILEIILNLKNLRIKFFGEEGEVIKLELKAKGKKKVTAKDIAKNSKVEVINEDLHIAEITDAGGVFEIDIYATSGFGYLPIEGRNTPEKEVGYIEVDSIFCPIRAVKVNIENVRVGQMTNWERLIIDIKTDGSLTFQEALKQATYILVEQFSFILDKAKEEVGEKKEIKKKEKKEKKKEEKEEDDSKNEPEEKSQK
ncbi:DNA-directed RNA polymerase subunit alpha [Candidatus Falkowbacteria bacterium CG10_big_fil_rev_8_21_14_0_10_43_10]|uniref:DNA-directed RNA polymerase subunit alpha n=1 Tax=Candidatus Falkowbacteria bacterium CG10_big_fil_rev_8_21_14_0_10_43_10 TaxID=1974567 RepID=A0A2H0V1T7_9BACT|nr:MAG: DNA-directed RNA polymerase subunit alpha [Candidatus Falkowbacteria bacterium CG10_big_fil_rev_8_21_14_0_10_43_10]